MILCIHKIILILISYIPCGPVNGIDGRFQMSLF